MKIRKLQLKNIGVFDDETIEFQPCPVKDKAEIHILTGQNGSGKSTILTALAESFRNYLTESFEKKFRYVENGETGFTTTFFNQDIVGIAHNPSQKRYRERLNSIREVGNYRRLLAYDDLAGADFPRQYLEKGLDFAVFSFSGYRQIKAEKIDAIKDPKEFNPLLFSLDFVKNYTYEHELSINQLIANNISKSAIEKDRNKAKSDKFTKVITSIEKVISEITGWQIKFDLQTEPTNLIIRLNDQELDFDVLPDGLRSLISWIGDLLSRIDLLKWQDDLPITEKNLILFLDEIEVHLHPKWQRKVLPVVQKLFKNAQIFVSTHSPFVVNSVDDAWVYKLKLKDGKATVADVVRSEDGISYQTVLSEIFDVDEEFGGKTQEDLDKFYKIVRNGSKVNKKELLDLAKSLAVQSEELNSIVQIELRQFSRRKGQEFSI